MAEKIRVKYLSLNKAYAEMNIHKDVQGISKQSLEKVLHNMGYYADT